jgi:hypothetical protein
MSTVGKLSGLLIPVPLLFFIKDNLMLNGKLVSDNSQNLIEVLISTGL